MDRLRPIQGALLYDPNITNDQDSEKDQHFNQAEQTELAVNDGPGKEKNRLHIEDYEKDRHHVVTGRVALPSIGIRIDAALVRGELALAARAWPDEPRHEQCHDRKQKSQSHEQKNRKISD